MKTAISIPDTIFDEAEALAARLGISRSELYATAVARFVEEQKSESITDALNEVYSLSDAALDPVLAHLQAQTLPDEGW
jgi:metal-responsive CopG/Arc/MetJ family transcriptional regulator